MSKRATDPVTPIELSLLHSFAEATNLAPEQAVARELPQYLDVLIDLVEVRAQNTPAGGLPESGPRGGDKIRRISRAMLAELRDALASLPAGSESRVSAADLLNFLDKALELLDARHAGIQHPLAGDMQAAFYHLEYGRNADGLTTSRDRFLSAPTPENAHDFVTEAYLLLRSPQQKPSPSWTKKQGAQEDAAAREHLDRIETWLMLQEVSPHE